MNFTLEQPVANFLASGEAPNSHKDRSALLSALRDLILNFIEPVNDSTSTPTEN